MAGGSWSSAAPTWSKGKYVWTRSVITYSDGTKTYTTAVCDASWEVANNIQAELSLKVDKETLISEINAAADVIKILSNRLQIESTNFSLSTDGKISSKKGDIGGWNIDEKILSNRLQIESTNFSLSTDGKISSKKGDIGGWNIDESCIYKETTAYVSPTDSHADKIRAYLLGTTNLTSDELTYFDINGDGVVDIKDAYLIRKIAKGEVEYTSCAGAIKSSLLVKIDATDATKTIKCTITNPIGEIVETYVGASQCNLPAIIGKSVYGDIIQGATIQTASGADLDEMNERLTWKTCTVTANSTYGYFYNNTSGAKYRYDDNILEVCVRGTYITKATVTENSKLMQITGLKIAISSAVNAVLWDDTAQIWRRATLTTDGYIILNSNASIPANYWLSCTTLNFIIFRT